MPINTLSFLAARQTRPDPILDELSFWQKGGGPFLEPKRATEVIRRQPMQTLSRSSQNPPLSVQ